MLLSPRSSWWTRRIVIALLGMFVTLQVFNAIRLNATGLNRSAQTLIARAEDLSNRAIPEYQDLILATLPPNPNNGPFYRFDDNLYAAKTIAETSRAGLDASEEFEFRLEFDGRQEAQLVAANGKSKIEQREGVLLVNHRRRDYLTTEKPLSIPLVKISEIILRARADRGNRFQIGWAAEGRESDLDENQVSLDLIADGEFHTYIVNATNAFQAGMQADENISRLAITPSNVDGAAVEIDFIRIVSKQWKYRLEQAGTSYETIDGELRPVMHMTPGQVLGYSVEVPAQDPVLSFGTGALFDEPPIQLTVSINTESGSTPVYNSSNASTDQWRDSRIDLSPWAGQSVRVVFEVRGPRANVAFWSNPIIHSAVRKRFNVIMVLEDTLRADHLSTQGYALETSPARTRFMDQQGIVFLNAHSQATKTRPSLPALMTSLHPTATGVWHFADSLNDRYLTLAEIMRAQGFATASFIQNGHAGLWSGLHQGFGMLRDEHTMGQTTEAIFGERIFNWLDKNGDRNFFLYLHAIDPHGVYDPPPPYDRWYRESPTESMVGEQSLSKPESFDPVWAEIPTADARRLLYDGEILHNDNVLDTFVEELRERDLLKDTVLVFLSDHGEWLGEYDRWGHNPPGQRPVIHVPFMISYPERFEIPRRIDESVQLIDAMPTILDLASVDSGDLLMQGDSLVSLIDGHEPRRWRNRITVSEEPMSMTRNNPCVCGSLFFDELQLHGTRGGWPAWLNSSFIKTGVYRFKEDGIRPVVSYLPDLYTRYTRHRTLSKLASANIATWRRLTEGQDQEVYRMDPATLEKLRGLGYVN